MERVQLNAAESEFHEHSFAQVNECQWHVVAPVSPCSPWFNTKAASFCFMWWADWGQRRPEIQKSGLMSGLLKCRKLRLIWWPVQVFLLGLQVRQVSSFRLWKLLWRQNPSKASTSQVVVLWWTSAPVSRTEVSTAAEAVLVWLSSEGSSN